MPQTSITGPIGEPLNVLDRIESSNNYAMARVQEGSASHGEAFLAITQTRGRGQRGKVWESGPGENLTISFVIAPGNLTLSNQFLLSASVSLACYDFLNKHAVSSSAIKWPNDIYWNDRKAAGILIENLIHGSSWLAAVVGIGFNLNQTKFSEDLSSAVSLKQITGRDFDLVSSAKELSSYLELRYRQLQDPSSRLIEEYNRLLYKKDESVKFQKGAATFHSMVKRVTNTGLLVTQDSIEREFSSGEVKWIR